VSKKGLIIAVFEALKIMREMSVFLGGSKFVKNVSGTPQILQLPPQHDSKKGKKVRGIMYCLVCPPPIQPFLGLIRPYFGKNRHFYTMFWVF
jgi:hypothetical protein